MSIPASRIRRASQLKASPLNSLSSLQGLSSRTIRSRTWQTRRRDSVHQLFPPQHYLAAKELWSPMQTRDSNTKGRMVLSIHRCFLLLSHNSGSARFLVLRGSSDSFRSPKPETVSFLKPHSFPSAPATASASISPHCPLTL